MNDETQSERLPSVQSQETLPSLHVQPVSRDVYATAKARQLLDCYPRGQNDAANPQIYLPAIASILAEYPIDIIDFVCDPRSGLPSKKTYGLPQPYDVREACEHQSSLAFEMVRRDRHRREATEAENGRAKMERERKTRPSYEEIKRKCHSVGLMIGMTPRDRLTAGLSVEELKKQGGLSDADWDCLPDRPTTWSALGDVADLGKTR